MNQTERFYIIDNLLQNSRFVTKEQFLNRLGISESAFKRDLQYMRDRLYAPIENDREQGYFLDKESPAMARYQLPGLWFNAQEIHAILTLQQYFENVSPKLLGSHVGPLRDRLKDLLARSKYVDVTLQDKIKIIHLGRRTSENEHFDKIAHELMSGQRVSIRYYSRPNDSYSDREVSPLRLVHYRENWYLDAWCHKANALRIFAVDAIASAMPTDKKARSFSKEEHDRHVMAGYGIFSGDKVEWATLRFSTERSRWVATEEWHPHQKRDFDSDGRYILMVPYSDDRELLMDILKYGSEVEVLGPDSLRNRVRGCLCDALRFY